ncbi:MAG: hypothetical protein J5639_07710, partial [Bacteroidales bacterium]|nr:hypothetical protein [Bacteroidales bacterium]
SAKRGGPSPEPPAAPPGENFSFSQAPFRHFLCSISDRKNNFPNPPSTHFVPIEERMAKFSPARKARKTSFKNQLFPGYAENNLLMLVYGRR